MITKIQSVKYFYVFLLLCISNSLSSIASDRKINIDNDWKFHLGKVDNAFQIGYDDSAWRVLDLPHDWSIEPIAAQKEGVTIGPFSKESIGKDATGQTVGGSGWYRKTFVIAPEDGKKLHTLYFEGIYNQSEIWINGENVYFNAYGYIPFKVDITKYCLAPGKTNTIAVKVANVGKNSRWYAGSGIYRHVWLIHTNPVHLDTWEAAVVTNKISGNSSNISISSSIFNETKKDEDVRLSIKISDPKQQEVYSYEEDTKVRSLIEKNIIVSADIANAQLWSVENPVMYHAEISLYAGKKMLDQISIPFGIRTISFSATEGFLLNNQSVKLKGGCIHHDNGFLGAKSIDKAEERKVELMKANGYNAVRCAHNPPAESFLNACDRLGMLVIDESFDQWLKSKNPDDYHKFFDEWSIKDLTNIVLRDRNHPSIIMWSIGNEIAERSDSIGMEIAQKLKKTIRKYDTSRAVTAGVNQYWDNRHLSWKDSDKAFKYLDVAGYNYMWHEYENDHKLFPERVMYGSESVPKEAAQNWNLVEKHPYIIGDFVWTAIDYLGEAGLASTLELAPGEHHPQFMPWPWYNGWCGDIDLCGDKKPQSYYRDILWKERVISMAVQAPVAKGKVEKVNYWGWKNELLSWNWPQYTMDTMTVNVYSKAPKVRLYLNNQLIGEKNTDPSFYAASFPVRYKPGELKAVAINNGKESETVILKTTGAASQIRLKADRSKIKADKNDLSYINIEITDKDGNVVPDADIHIKLSCTGNGKIIGSGNAAPDDMDSFNSLNPKVFRGKAMVILQPNGKPGKITLTVSANEMAAAQLKIETY